LVLFASCPLSDWPRRVSSTAGVRVDRIPACWTCMYGNEIAREDRPADLDPESWAWLPGVVKVKHAVRGALAGGGAGERGGYEPRPFPTSGNLGPPVARRPSAVGPLTALFENAARRVRHGAGCFVIRAPRAAVLERCSLTDRPGGRGGGGRCACLRCC
jgi:hypothetical protein